MKKRLGLLLFLWFPLCAFAQRFGNEWIDLNQTYFKLSVAETGMYRVSYDELVANGVPVNAFDPRQIQLWRRGNEQAIRVVGEEDGTFDQGDYIEFYGQKNDGQLDSSLYFQGKQPHQYYSLYTDTSAYFLTWSSANTNKRMASEAGSGGSSASYLIHDDLKLFTTHYYNGDEPETYVHYSEGSQGEGWFSREMHNKNPTLTYTFSDVIDVVSSGGFTPTLEVMFVGRNKAVHEPTISVNGEVFSVPQFENHQIKTVTITPNLAGLVDGELSVTIDKGTNSSYLLLAYIRLRYARTLDLGGKEAYEFKLPQGVNQVSLANPVSGIQLYNITDAGGVQFIPFVSNSGKIDFSVDASSEQKLLATKSYLKPSKISSVTFKDDLVGDPNFLMVTHKDFWSNAEEYKNYRESAEGGGHRVNLVEFNRLVDQYAYGEKSPMAIRRWADYNLQNGNPQNLLLLGKGLLNGFRVVWTYYRNTPHDKLDGNGNLVFKVPDYIPTFGDPGSDILYTAGLNGKPDLVPAIPTGRIPVSYPEELKAYLDKLKEHESLSFNAPWRKKILHLSGGKDAFEANQFANYMQIFAKNATGQYFGGQVSSVTKQSSEEVKFFDISSQINDGLSLLTYFGHSSPRLTEIDFGEVDNPINGYENKGKYPVLYFNGCHTGDVFISYAQTRTENWLLAPDKGAIAVMAHAYYGYSGQLATYCDKFYQYSFEDSLYSLASMGEVQQKIIEDLSVAWPKTNAIAHTQLTQFTLFGDPAMRLAPADKAEYDVKTSGISVHPIGMDELTAQSDSFQIAVVVENFGRVTNDSITVCVSHSFDDGNQFVDYGPISFPGIESKDTLWITLKGQGEGMAGENQFEITLDCINALDEYDKSNNNAKIEEFLPSNGLIPLMPKEFSIVGNDTIDFVAQAFDLMTPDGTNYWFQLDTSGEFYSPLVDLKTTAGVLPIWENVVLPDAKDSAVYYWRVKFEDLPEEEGGEWRYSSLIYLEGQQGWGQGAYYQFAQNVQEGITSNDFIRQFSYDTSETAIVVNASGLDVENYLDSANLRVNNRVIFIKGGSQPTSVNEGKCATGGFVIQAFDRNTGLPYFMNSSGEKISDGGNCGNTPRLAYSLNSNTNGLQNNLRSYLERIPEGDYVLITSVGNTFPTRWQSSFKGILLDFGATLLDSLDEGEPYILLAQVGTRKVLFEKVGDSTNQVLKTSFILETQTTKGKLVSPLIGPASGWNHYSHQWISDSTESARVDFYGVNTQGKSLFLHTQPSDSVLSPTLLEDMGLNASDFPYLRLEVSLEDTLQKTAPQPDHWYVHYSGVPEGILDPAYYGVEKYQNLAFSEGDSLQLNFAFRNISNQEFDSLLVRFTVRNLESGEIVNEERKLGPLDAKALVTFPYSFPTTGFIGDNNIQVYVNPRQQVEENYDNNIMNFNFYVGNDVVQPLLDVVFDGKHIADGQEISKSPLITVSLSDENEYLQIKDTSAIQMFIQRPCQDLECPYEPIYFSNPSILKWEGSTQNTPFLVDYNPQDLPPGTYRFRVTAKDASGNSAGAPYEISFTVNEGFSISNFYPYPNPFSTGTRFVFKVTGSEVPENVTIQIMSPSGTILREITKEEIGPIQVGDNITSYEWDGTDQFGNQLANGVYLYRVLMQKDGEELEVQPFVGEEGFKKNFGKLYILR